MLKKQYFIVKITCKLKLNLLSTIMWKKNQNIFKATLNALNGLKSLVEEKSAKREIYLILLALFFLLYEPNIFTSTIFILSIILLAFESFNSAIENLCDYLTAKDDPKIRIIKDLSASAIFLIIISIISVVIIYLFSIFFY
ncbi:diacylglycerol kinase [Candidatus Pelagibacter sp.]|nr:diacylglycerol kinase [Candidatus Pelagibacter sp.]